MKNITIFPAAILLGVLLPMLILPGACSLPSTQVPADHFYRLPEPQADRLAQPVFDHILIRPVRVEGLYHERAILFVEENSPLELQRYRYHFWVEPPAPLVAGYMKNWLRQSGLAERVSTDSSLQRPSLEISVLITAFERQLGDQGVSNRLAMDISLHYPEQPEKDRSKTYHASVSSDSLDMHDTARGFGEALGQIMQQLQQDLSKTGESSAPGEK